MTWDWLAKRTIGVQWINAIDSISANIAEGFGRYTRLDKVHFYRISFGSVTESLDWLQKAKTRQLINQAQYDTILKELQVLPKELHQLINYTKDKLKE